MSGVHDMMETGEAAAAERELAPEAPAPGRVPRPLAAWETETVASMLAVFADDHPDRNVGACMREAAVRLRSSAALDAVYLERNRVVAALARMARALGYRVGIGRPEINGWDPAWLNCLYIDLPEGQVSWHFHDRDMPLLDGIGPYPDAWDGHTTDEKYARLASAEFRAVRAEGV